MSIQPDHARRAVSIGRRRPSSIATSESTVAIRGGKAHVLPDAVAREQALTLVINDQVLFTVLCSPAHEDELVLGCLISEGIIGSRDDVAGMTQDPLTRSMHVRLAPGIRFDSESFSRRRVLGTGLASGLALQRRWEDLGVPSVDAPFGIDSAGLIALMSSFLQLSEHHHETGCIHVAALADEHAIRLFREDIGRHNAVDKVIGAAAASRMPVSGYAFLVSGRISSEMMLKAARVGVPLVATRAAVTDAAIRVARMSGITLAGFVRARRINVYSHPWRIRDAIAVGDEGDDRDEF